MKRSFGDSVARHIGIGKGTETQSFSMLMPLKEGKKKTLFWGCGMMMEFGARIKTASLPLQYPILRRFSPLPPQVESMKSHVHYQDVLQMI